MGVVLPCPSKALVRELISSTSLGRPITAKKSPLKELFEIVSYNCGKADCILLGRSCECGVLLWFRMVSKINAP